MDKNKDLYFGTGQSAAPGKGPGSTHYVVRGKRVVTATNNSDDAHKMAKKLGSGYRVVTRQPKSEELDMSKEELVESSTIQDHYSTWMTEQAKK